MEGWRGQRRVSDPLIPRVLMAGLPSPFHRHSMDTYVHPVSFLDSGPPNALRPRLCFTPSGEYRAPGIKVGWG